MFCHHKRGRAMLNTYEVLTLLFVFGGFLFELLEYIQKNGK